jgi:hypothetical protein
MDNSKQSFLYREHAIDVKVGYSPIREGWLGHYRVADKSQATIQHGVTSEPHVLQYFATEEAITRAREFIDNFLGQIDHTIEIVNDCVVFRVRLNGRTWPGRVSRGALLLLLAGPESSSLMEIFSTHLDRIREAALFRAQITHEGDAIILKSDDF